MLHALTTYKDYGNIRVETTIDSHENVTVTVYKRGRTMNTPVATYATDYYGLCTQFNAVSDLNGKLKAEYGDN